MWTPVVNMDALLCDKTMLLVNQMQYMILFRRQGHRHQGPLHSPHGRPGEAAGGGGGAPSQTGQSLVMFDCVRMSGPTKAQISWSVVSLTQWELVSPANFSITQSDFPSPSQLPALNLRNLWESLVTAETPAGLIFYFHTVIANCDVPIFQDNPNNP